ncbi:hypothetical protein [Breoghania sp.]|uniref:hypothetical protein n=1 Tax=Breoghania sp. TaxID=2065378 RepID=UPI002611F3F6|nr:hypothetical protein [Breoghania sp.]MDJ0931856.1 hypothetical protein [Breoghania sp.]
MSVSENALPAKSWTLFFQSPAPLAIVIPAKAEIQQPQDSASETGTQHLWNAGFPPAREWHLFGEALRKATTDTSFSCRDLLLCIVAEEPLITG